MGSKEQQIKNGMIYLLPIIAGGIMPFISLGIFTRVLTRGDYGALALAQIYAIFSTGIANFGMTISYDRNFFQYKNNILEKSGLLYSSIGFVLINFLVVFLITLVFHESLSSFVIGTTQYGYLLLWVFCGHFFVNISYYYLTFYKNSEIAGQFAFYSILLLFLHFIISLFFVVYLKIGVVGIAYSQFFSGLIVFVILSFRFLRFIPFSWNKKILLESLKLSYPLTPRIFLGVINTQFDKYIIRVFTTIGGVGIYSIGQRISNVIFIIMTALQNVYSPRIYQEMFENKTGADERIGRYLTPFAYISIFVALMVCLGAEEIVYILTPETYHDAVDIILILSMYFGFLFFGKICSNQLVFAKKTNISSILSVLNITLNIGINIQCAKYWGVIGVAWGTFIANLISGLIAFVVSQRYFKIKWEYYKIGAIFITFFSVNIILLVLRYYSADFLAKLLVKLIFLIVYIGLGVKFKVITLNNFTIIKNMISQKIIKN